MKPSRPRYRDVLNDARFIRYLGAQVVNQAGDVLYDLGVVWLTLEATGSVTAAGAVAAAGLLPSLFVGPLAGMLADYVPPRKILVLTDLGRAAVMVLLVLFTLTTTFPPTWLLLAVTFVLGIGTRLYIPARFALLPSLISETHYGAANALSTFVSQGRFVLGGLLTFFVLQAGNPATVFVLNAVTFLVAAYLTLQIRAVAPASSTRRRPADSRFLQRSTGTLLQGLHEYVMVLSRRDTLRPLGLVAMDSLLLAGAWTISAPLLAESWSGVDGGRGTYSFLQTTYGIGTLIGCYLIGRRLVEPAAIARVLMLGYLTRAAAFLALPFVSVDFLGLGLGLTVLIGLAIPSITVTVPTLLHRITPPEEMGRVFGAYTLLNSGLMSVSIFIYGLMAEYFAAQTFFLTAAMLSMAMLFVIPAMNISSVRQPSVGRKILASDESS
jgi:DHA3 family macrolide efflux protein-like MFS transporter